MQERGSQWAWQGKEDNFQKFLIYPLQPLQCKGEDNVKPKLTCHWKPHEHESEITVHADGDGNEHCGKF